MNLKRVSLSSFNLDDKDLCFKYCTNKSTNIRVNLSLEKWHQLFVVQNKGCNIIHFITVMKCLLHCFCCFVVWMRYLANNMSTLHSVDGISDVISNFVLGILVKEERIPCMFSLHIHVKCWKFGSFTVFFVEEMSIFYVNSTMLLNEC